MSEADYKGAVRDYYIKNVDKLATDITLFSAIKLEFLKTYCAPGIRVLSAGCGNGTLKGRLLTGWRGFADVI